jgi:exopolyphosphatase / guanosine-5'-triphosphate,3'-diphosphate pyrophosphatase
MTDSLTRRAVIDIGTNSVKLLVGDVADGIVTPVFEAGEQTRLGQGLYESNRLQPEAITRTVECVTRFAAKTWEMGAASIRVIATSATRDALNGTDLVQAIQEHANLSTEVISGATEAEWVYRGVLSDPELATHPLLILDVGGGSTEFIVTAAGERQFDKSFQVGTVRLLEKFPPADPPSPTDLNDCQHWLEDLLENSASPLIAPHLPPQGSPQTLLVGTGGAALILARIHLGLPDFTREQMEGLSISTQDISAIRERLWKLPLAERRLVIGLPPERADVMLMGALIYECVLRQFGIGTLRVSTRGLRYAALVAP